VKSDLEVREEGVRGGTRDSPAVNEQVRKTYLGEE
jgi:hypothetical protein